MRAILAIFIAALLLGLIGPVVKVIGGDVSPYTISFFRVFFAFLFLFALYPFYKDDIFGISKSQMLDKFIIGAAMAFAFSTWVIAFKYAPISNVVFLGSTQAIFAGLFGYLLLGEKTTKREVAALIVTIIGISVINPFEPKYLAGNLLAISNSIAFGFLIAFMKKRSRNHTYRSLLWSFFFASILLLPLLFIGGAFPLKYLPHILFLGILCTGLSYLLFIYGLKRVQVEISSLMILIITPLVGILLGILFLGEEIVARIVIGGMLLIASGIILLKGKVYHS